MAMDAEEGETGFDRKGKSTSPAPASRLLTECLGRAVVYGATLPGRFFEILEKDLAEQVSNVFASPGQSRIIEGLRIVQNGRADLAGAFPQRLEHRFGRQTAQDAPRSGGSGGGDSAPGLSLVDDSELEESLAVNTLIGKLRERHSDELFGLAQRYDELAPGAGDELPFEPGAFCNAFRDALDTLDLEAPARAHCYKLLERVLSPGLGEFYAELNKLLIGQGVLPQLKARIRTQASASTSHPAGRGGHRRGAVSGDGPGGGTEGPGGQYPLKGRDSPEGPDPRGGAGFSAGTGSAGEAGASGGAGVAGGGGGSDDFLGETVPQIPQEPVAREPVFQAMHHLLGGYAGGPEGGAQSVDGRPSAMVYLPATPMLLDTLSSLQHDPALVEHTGELLRGGLKQHVVGRFATVDAHGRPGMINQIDDETIDVISMIFDYIFDDEMLPDFVKALIGRLQIPVLKAAIVDREFFSDRVHPVRQLLNDLASAGMGWGEEADVTRDRLYEKMEVVVRRILGEFEENIGLFAEVLGDFRAFLEEEKKNFALLQQQIGTEIHEAERLEQLRLAVAEEIAGRVAGRDVPAEVREFLGTVWRQLLTEVTLEEGRDGAWRVRALRAMDDLIWSLEPKRNAEQRRRLGVLLPVLLADLREGQVRIGRREEEVEAFVAVLERYHFAGLRSSTARGAAPAAATGVESVVAAAPPQDGDTDAAGLDEVDRMFREIGGDLGDLPEIDMEGLSGFDDLLERKDPERQSRFDQMMAEMGFEMEGDGGPRIEDAHTERVRGLELGSWVELTDPDGRKRRVKLAWAGDAYSNYSFVNRQYKVVAERPLYVLAEEFRNGTARVIENVALFDRALDGVISGIMKFARPRPPEHQVRHA